MKKAFRIITGLLITLMITAILILVAPRIFGVKLYSVLSGSMEPAYSVGDLLYVFPQEASDIKEGDVITFVLNDDGTVATHRVVEVDKENKQFYTKGDANELSDGRPVRYENVLGKVKFAIPVIGFIIGYMSTVPGKIVTITIIVAIILLIFLLQTQIEKEEEDEEEDIWEARPERKSSSVKRRQTQTSETSRIVFNERKKDKKKENRRDSRKEENDEYRDEKIAVQKKTAAEPMKEPARKFAKESVPKEKIKHFNQERKSLRFEPRQTVDDREDIQVPDTYRKNSGRPVRHEPLDASLDYKCQKLQVCYKMLTLMETMWDDTINGDFRETQSQEVGVVYEDEPEIWNFDEGSYIDIEKNEKGGEKPYARKTEERYTIS